MLLEASPAHGSSGVPSFTPLRLTFSGPMHKPSVEQNLMITPKMEGSFDWEDDTTVIFTPASLWPGNEIVTATLTMGAQSNWRLPLAERQTWSFTIAETLLAYLWPAEGLADIYVLDPVSGETVRLTETARGVLDFSIGAGGKAFYYATPNPEGGTNIIRFDRLTGDHTLVHDCGTNVCTSPHPSPDDSLLAYADETIWLIFGAETQPIELGGAFSPLWSPQGLLTYFDPSRLAFVFYNTENSTEISFRNQTGAEGAWAPDGKTFIAPEIIFSDASGELLASHLFQFNLSTRLATDVSIEQNVEDNSPAYSPNGSLLAFARKYLDAERWTPGRQLWLMSAAGAAPQKLTDAPAYNHAAFAWHPRGNQIAYVRSNMADLNEQPEIWIINTDGTNPLRVVVGGFSPVWVP